MLYFGIQSFDFITLTLRASSFSQKLVLILTSLLMVWSYFSFFDKWQDKSGHHVHAWFSWSLPKDEILTPTG